MLLTRMKEIAGTQNVDRGARISGPWLTAYYNFCFLFCKLGELDQNLARKALAPTQYLVRNGQALLIKHGVLTKPRLGIKVLSTT